jgi:hypothetical protein
MSLKQIWYYDSMTGKVLHRQRFDGSNDDKIKSPPAAAQATFLLFGGTQR